MKRFSNRKDFVTPPDQMNTYDVNFEYTKKSLGKVSNFAGLEVFSCPKGTKSDQANPHVFKKYLDRPPQERKIIYNEYYIPLDQIYGSMKTKDPLVAFSAQKPRDDLMYRQESKVGSKLSNLIGNSLH